MLEMPIRTGRRLQDAARQIKEGISRRTDERQRVNSLHRQRMTCSDSMRSLTNTQDWMNGMSMSPSGRFQVVEEKKPKLRLFSRDGIRRDAAVLMLLGVAVLCVAILLADIAGLGLGGRSISRLDRKIADLTARNDMLKQELSYSAGDVSVCTEALKFNLISGYGAQTITLTAPHELSLGAVTAEVRETGSGWITGFAGD